MDLEGLRSFVAISREKSISKAALALHLTQPSLSSRIRKLEESLGVKLLERSWDGVKLTLRGHYFLGHAIELLRVIQDAATAMQLHDDLDWRYLVEVHNPHRLTIGINRFYNQLLFKPLIDELLCHYPDLEYKIVACESNNMIDYIDSGLIHLGIGIMIDRAQRKSLQSLPILEDELVLLYPEGFGVELLEDEDLTSALKDKRLILVDNRILVNTRENAKRIFEQLIGGMPERYHVVDEVGTVLELVARGAGYAAVYRLSVNHLLEAYPAVRVLPIGRKYPKRLVHVVYNENSAAPIPLRSLADQLLVRFTRT